MPTWPKQDDVDTYYGNPRGNNGHESARWCKQFLTVVPPPWALVTSWDGEPVRGVRVHKKCAESLATVFDAIWLAAGSQAVIDKWGMNLYGGAFNFRLMKNGKRLSMHSWGCAVDFDPKRNGYGESKPNFALIKPVREAFAAEGWVWGGAWNTPDGMHWQAAIV